MQNDNTIRSDKSSGILETASNALGNIGGFATLLMVILVTFNAISRKLFNWSIPGFYEVIGVVGAVFYAFGIVYAATKGQHIIMNLVISHIPEGLQKICNAISRVIILFFCGLFAYAGGSVTLQMLSERTADIRIPVAPFRFLVVIALVALAVLILAGKDIGKEGEQ